MADTVYTRLLARGIEIEGSTQALARKLLGRCTRCDGTEFRRYDANAPLRMTSVLECCSCFAQVIHGNLLAELGKDAVANMHAGAARARRRPGRKMTTPSAGPTAAKA